MSWFNKDFTCDKCKKEVGKVMEICEECFKQLPTVTTGDELTAQEVAKEIEKASQLKPSTIPEGYIEIPNKIEKEVEQ